MTLADRIDIANSGDLTDRAYLRIMAAWRRSRPRREVGAWFEAAILAMLERAARVTATLHCATCEGFRVHAHAGDVADELAGQAVRMWRCDGCGSVRQFGAIRLRTPAQASLFGGAG